MFSRLLCLLAGLLALPGCDSRVVKAKDDTGMYTHTMQDLHGAAFNLADRTGEVTLIVNVASQCGYTAQYRDLQALQDSRAGTGFLIIGVPCNDFGGQEPGDASAITACAAGLGASFPLLAKAVVKDQPGQSPLYRDLGQATGVLPKWNFGKYLIGRDGATIGYFGPGIGPMDPQLTDAIDAALEASAS